MIKTGRPKGGKNRKWSKEEKLNIIQDYLNRNIGINKYAREAGLSKGMFWRWLDVYRRLGESGLETVVTKNSGNPFAALHSSKSLTEGERLRLIIAKQEVEIERLKKGYSVKGDGVNKEFATTKDVSLK